jgi:acetylglutamate synthase
VAQAVNAPGAYFEKAFPSRWSRTLFDFRVESRIKPTIASAMIAGEYRGRADKAEA